MLKQIKFVGIAVRNQDAALDFWTQKVGLRIATDQPMEGGGRWIELHIPGAQTGVALFTPPGEEHRIGTFHSLSFVANDVEETYRELTARGVEFVTPPKKEEWGTFATFKDIDGNTFVLGTA
jgi:predicted enzyme related to lactoylglutathione lyase